MAGQWTVGSRWWHHTANLAIFDDWQSISGSGRTADLFYPALVAIGHIFRGKPIIPDPTRIYHEQLNQAFLQYNPNEPSSFRGPQILPNNRPKPLAENYFRMLKGPFVRGR